MLLRSPLLEDGSELVVGHDDVSVDLRYAVYVIEQPPQDGAIAYPHPGTESGVAIKLLRSST